jgi:ATP-dependent RNA helicase DeaD
MLSMGFYPDMMEIRDFLPKDRQSYMFSATMPAKVRTVARDFLDEPGFLSLSSEGVSVKKMKYDYYLVPKMQKDSTLRRLIELEEPGSSIIFCNTKREVSYVTQFLNNSGYEAEEMSGDLAQTAREEAIDRLRDGKTRFLVATDVAARGIDVTELSHVFIYDVPQDREYLIHRSGRTARAGKKGTTIILATHEDEFELLRMARRYEIEVERKELPEDPIQVAEDAMEAKHRETNAPDELIDEFVPLVSRIAQSQPELLATLVAELYETVQAEKEAAEEDND